MDYIFFSGYYDFAAFVLISSILFLIIRGFIRAIIKAIKYLISMPKKKKQAEELRQMKEKWRLQDEAWRKEEEKALRRQLIAFMKENLK